MFVVLKKALKKVLNEKSTKKSAQQSTQKTLNGKSTQKSAQKNTQKSYIAQWSAQNSVFTQKSISQKKMILECTNIFKKVLKKASALSGTEFSIEDGFGY